ncbi:MAG TPA: glycosyltransferase family 39 protein [Gemmatimonadaceae bacterium]|nr:glycosyltransferase family 39 protein [Gemmatimonadaceae bacterium]
MTLLQPETVDADGQQYHPHWLRPVPTEARYDRAAIVLVFVALMIALRYAAAHQLGTLGQETDLYGGNGIEFHAKRLLDGQPFTYRFNPPGYPMLVAGMSRLTGGDLFLAGKLLTVLATALYVGLTYLLGRALAGARVGFATALLSLVTIVPFSFLAAIDLVSAVSMLGAMWMLVRANRRWVAAAAMAGVVAGIAYLIRWHAIYLLIGTPICLLFLDADGATARRRRMAIAAFVAGWLLIASPWLIWNWRTYGGPFASDTYMQVAAHFHAPDGDGSGFTRDQMGKRFHSLGEVLGHEPVRVAKQYLREMVLSNPPVLFQELVRYPGYLFFGAGLLMFLLNHTRRRLAFALLCTLGYAILGLLGFYTRLHLFLVPALVLPVALVLFHPVLADAASRRRLPAAGVSWGLCLAIAVLTAYQTFGLAAEMIAAEPHHLARAAQWLRQRSSPGDRVALAKPHVASWSGLGEFYSPAQTLDELVADARRSGVRFVLYSPSEHAFPAFRPLGDTTRVHPDLALAYRDPSPLTLIYEVRVAR